MCHFSPDKWPLRISLFDNDGNPKQIDDHTKLYDIAGPCCLGMDVVAFDRELPEVHPGDYIVLRDTGAYYHASFSYYNSRNPPIFIGFKENPETKETDFQLLCNIRTVDDTVEYFA